jgi:hypothetical protein
MTTTLGKHRQARAASSRLVFSDSAARRATRVKWRRHWSLRSSTVFSVARQHARGAADPGPGSALHSRPSADGAPPRHSKFPKRGPVFFAPARDLRLQTVSSPASTTALRFLRRGLSPATRVGFCA